MKLLYVAEIPLEDLPLEEEEPSEERIPVEEFTDDFGRTVRVCIVRKVLTKTITVHGTAIVSKEPKEYVIYLVNNRQVPPETIKLNGKPLELKQPEDLLPRVSEMTPVEIVPYNDGIPVEEFTDDEGRVV